MLAILSDAEFIEIVDALIAVGFAAAMPDYIAPIIPITSSMFCWR